MYAYQNRIVSMVAQHQVNVIVGDTGSGKSTQICQFLVENDVVPPGSAVVCTQPRKVAAISLAKHVSIELTSKLGKAVDYMVGRRRGVNPSARIVFATDRCLLDELLKDDLLSKYSVVIIDEAHERSIHTDLLIGLIKRCLLRRPDLKVIITSATIDPTLFSNYFNGCPILTVPGRMYPVNVHYSEQILSTESYVDRMVEQVKLLHDTMDPGGILAFLVTPLDCEKCCEQFTDLDDVKCLSLHGQLPPDRYQELFSEVSAGLRKIVFATNCAETSITLPGVKYVVDCGLAKESQYDTTRNATKLVISAINKSSANQRKGRAGRIESGECFRLYTEAEYESFKDSSVPEILRANLRLSLLQLIALGVADPSSFEFVESPGEANIRNSISSLISLGAINSQGQLTPLGRQMTCLPLDPKYSRFILNCCDLNLGFTAIAMTAMCQQGGLVFF